MVGFWGFWDLLARRVSEWALMGLFVVSLQGLLMMLFFLCLGAKPLPLVVRARGRD